MVRYSVIYIFLPILLFFMGCERVEYFPDHPLKFDSTLILAHRGGGYFDEGNTLKGCIYGLQNFEGIECDIQISKSGTLWLSHSNLVPVCGNKGGNCFSLTIDEEIIEIDSCLGPQKNLTALEEVFAYMSVNFREKKISLDVKPWKPCEMGEFNLIREMNYMAQAIIDLAKYYHLESSLLVESESGDFLYYLKIHSHIETYLAVNGDFEMGVSRALHGGFTGISFKYNFLEELTLEKVELLHRKGLKIQIWTIDGKEEILKALDLKPDFIQTDEIFQ